MRERLVEWGLLILAVVGVVVLIVAGKGTRGNFDDLVISKDKWYEIISAREKTSEGMVSRVSFNGEELITAEGGMEWYYSVVERQENAKNPEVSYRAEEGVKLVVMEDKMTDEKIRSGEATKMMAYSDSKYEIYELFVTTLPVMKISHLGARDLTKDEGEVKMKMELFDNEAGAKQRWVMTEGDIEVRGAVSANFPKRGYRLNLRTKSVGENRRPNNTALLGMRQDDDWVLYSAYNDQEKVRNVFATNLWKEGQAKNNEFHIDNGMEYKYVELIMNDEYYGLYALGYPIDELQLGLKVGTDGKYDEFSFKKVLWNTNVEDVLDSYELKTEVTEPKRAWRELSELLDELRYGQNAEALRTRVDIGNAIDVRLFIELTQSMDTLGGEGCDDMKNLYITLKRRGEEGIWLFTPWDFDLTFGNIWSGDEINATTKYALEAGKNWEIGNGDVVGELIKVGDGEIVEEMKARYRELRKGAWSEENLMEMIDEYEKEIYRSGAFSRDKERWPDGNYNDVDEELTRFREYVLERLKAMDEKYL